MTTFILLFGITFLMISTTALLINYCRKRAGNTRHGLTGMCHKTGGTMCAGCSEKLSRPPS